ncbi:hypothetical protein ABZ567_04335 [Streptomyces sp. NPDC016459]|uniref:hypothetical protein n=1 Tax=Streptomyces sp. NPDC016459 TaxID=3157190 RepID=UPI00340DEE18
MNAGRLLPWTGEDGRPCYLLSDGSGRVARLADDIETLQLGMAGELLAHAAELLADRRASSGELRYLARCLAGSLRDVKRVADSRGGQLARREP